MSQCATKKKAAKAEKLAAKSAAKEAKQAAVAAAKSAKAEAKALAKEVKAQAKLDKKAPKASKKTKATKPAGKKKSGKAIKTVLLLGAVAAVGYVVYKKSQPQEDPWVTAAGEPNAAPFGQGPGAQPEVDLTNEDAAADEDRPQGS